MVKRALVVVCKRVLLRAISTYRKVSSNSLEYGLSYKSFAQSQWVIACLPEVRRPDYGCVRILVPVLELELPELLELLELLLAKERLELSAS